MDEIKNHYFLKPGEKPMVRSTKDKFLVRPRHLNPSETMPHEENLFFDYYLRQNKNNQMVNKDAAKFDTQLLEFV